MFPEPMQVSDRSQRSFANNFLLPSAIGTINRIVTKYRARDLIHCDEEHELAPLDGSATLLSFT
jgi:hypothetical protein